MAGCAPDATRADSGDAADSGETGEGVGVRRASRIKERTGTGEEQDRRDRTSGTKDWQPRTGTHDGGIINET